MSLILTADQILNADDLKPVDVPVPEWAPPGTDAKAATVLVRGMTGEERDSLEVLMYEVKKGVAPEMDWGKYAANVRANLAVRGLCDAQGNRLFRDDQADLLARKNARALDRVADKVRELSGMRAEQQEEAEKNSPPAPSDSSPGGLRVITGSSEAPAPSSDS